MTFGSLFAGIGGFDLGFERAGMRCVWQVEISEWCRRVLAKHWPTVPKADDVRTFDGQGFERPDVVCGGFPCQDISVAGNQAGIAEGTRSILWSEYARIVRVLRPRYVVVENVAALLYLGMDRVLGDLAGMGYNAEWGCLTASMFGAPHKRERIFVVAHDHEDEHPHVFSSQHAGKVAEGFQWWRGRLDELGPSDGVKRSDSYAGIRRDVDGIPNWVDRLGGCGNAVIPAAAQWIGQRLMEASWSRRRDSRP